MPYPRSTVQVPAIGFATTAALLYLLNPALAETVISPGHRVDVAFAERLVRQLLAGRRLPEPIYWADRLSKQGADEERGQHG